MNLSFNNYILQINNIYSRLLKIFNIPETANDNQVVKLEFAEDESKLEYEHLTSKQVIVKNNKYVFIFNYYAEPLDNKEVETNLKYPFDNNAEIKNIIISHLCNTVTNVEYLYNGAFDDEHSIISLTKDINAQIQTVIERYLLNDCDLFIELSNAKYENNVCKGIIVLGHCDETNSLITLSNDNEKIVVDSSNKRMIRKLLEVSSKDVALHISKDETSNQYYVKDFVSKDSESNKDYKYVIVFLGYRHFQFYKDNRLFIEYNIDKFCLQSQIDIPDEEKNKIISFFKKNGSSKAKKTLRLISDIYKLGNDFHGSLIIFTDDEKFLERMHSNNRSTQIYNKDLNIFECYNAPKKNEDKINIIKRLSCVDGAIVIDLEGNIRSFGTILDGRSNCKGRRDRGSRFNSAKTFIHDYIKTTKDKRYLAIVMSEDGPVNVFNGEEND